MAVVKKPDRWTARDGTNYGRHTVTQVMFKLGYTQGLTDEHAAEYVQHLQKLEKLANPVLNIKHV